MTSPFQHAHAELINAVIRQIDAYQGEVIVKGEHPLWLAVVELEKVMRPGPKVNKLDPPAAVQWYCCLWASRPNMRNVPLGERPFAGEPFAPADPQLAIGWAAILRQTLVEFLERGESGYDQPRIYDP